MSACTRAFMNSNGRVEVWSNYILRSIYLTTLTLLLTTISNPLDLQSPSFIFLPKRGLEKEGDTSPTLHSGPSADPCNSA